MSTEQTDAEFIHELGNELDVTFRNVGRTNFSEYCYVLNKRGHVISLSCPYITSFPSQILNLQHLVRLYLRKAKFDILPVEFMKLPKLKYLELWEPIIREVPAAYADWQLPIKISYDKTYYGMLLKDAEIETPPIEIVARGSRAIRTYYSSIAAAKDDLSELNEAKVLLVGDGGAGKTSLVRRILGEEFDQNELQTHGISIREFSFTNENRPIKANFWDFGGQEIMHATHQFFLSRRSLYILLLDGRKDEKIEYWLKHIESFGGDSPILVVLNKIDQHPGFEVNRKFLKTKYEGIESFSRISCASNEGITEFVLKLRETIANLSVLKTTWPKKWFHIKSRLESLERDFISFEEYRKICREYSVTEADPQDTLLDFLHDLGVVLHFKEYQLLDTHVLDPRWVTTGVYTILNSETLASNNGILPLNQLSDILPSSCEAIGYGFPPEKYQYLVELMLKFQLCYKIDSQTVLIPDLLTVSEPDFDFPFEEALCFHIKYDFLPRSILPRFIVKMHADIVGDLRWRTGVVISDPSFSSTAVIKIDTSESLILIWVEGSLRRDYFSVIRHAFGSINAQFEKLRVIERVPLPDESNVSVSYAHLLRLEQRGICKFMPDGSEKDYSVQKLLGTIYKEDHNEDEVLQILRKLRDDADDKESLLVKANEIVQLQPNFFGIGINLNAIVDKLLSRKK